MFINLSNHPSVQWPPEQLEAASAYGAVLDIPFPHISPQNTDSDLDFLADRLCCELVRLQPSAVLVQGEMVFTYRLVMRLISAGITAVAACTERIASERRRADGTIEKFSLFRFSGFRLY